LVLRPLTETKLLSRRENVNKSSFAVKSSVRWR